MHAQSKMCEQNALHLAKHSELGSKNLNKICVKIIQKAQKYPLLYANFQKFSGEACPRTLLYLYLFLNHLQICSAEKKKRLKKCGNYAASLLKFLATPLSIFIAKT